MTTGRLYAISPSKLGTWLDCPRRFFLQYVERQRASGSWAHLSMGNAIHNALRDWFDDPAAPRTHERAEALVRATIAGAPERYEADWARITRRHLFLTRLLLQVARRPWLRRRLVRALRRFPSGFAVFLAMNTGYWSPWRAIPAAGAVGIGLLTG